MGAKELVLEYYNSQAYANAEALKRFIHNDIVLQWNSSKGYLELDKDDLLALAAELNKSYISSRVNISHIIEEGDTVSVRYTHYVHAFENPDEEMVLANFMVIWEIKDNQFYKGFLMSQLA
ncbi:DUF4440 domain-containing protein [Flavobacterium rakeshii]|uniref:DUF4440 domain-containing protein n=2 Tax=Flavobacterium TaxID=237 RepID=A0A6N8HAH0_9FLAO|nr:nuclear transport factor 2 family protein [Flavobacterium rakeshii]MEE1899952.1 nuclear transport factor 2 family protein [Flavobacterium rakeshii]MUV02565.1 DUF4440 domain-containing protein [Flavobacterium rakeshii]